MHIVCLYFHYASPDCPAGGRAYSLLQELGKEHRVTVFTGAHYHALRQTNAYDWAPPGVQVQMLDVPYANAMTSPQRLAAYASFPVWAGAQACRVSDADVLYAISTPLTTPMAAAAAARGLGVPWVLEIRDLWPDVPIQMGALPSPLLQRPLRWAERRLYHDAAHVVTVSPDMTAHVESTGVPPARVTTLPQGTDCALLDRPDAPSPNELRDCHDLGTRPVVLYAGAFGRANDIPTLLSAAEQLAGRSGAHIVFIGHGYYDSDIEAAARRLPNVRRIAPQPRHRMMPWFQLATLSLVSFLDRPVLGTNAPAKLFDSLAAGTPVVVTNPGWMTRFVQRHDCGWAVPPSAPHSLADRIARVVEARADANAAGRRGAAVVRDHYDRADQADALESIFYRAATSP
ncbi:MAG: glycosyltransferase family 4 protein [Salinibacter sp.]